MPFLPCTYLHYDTFKAEFQYVEMTNLDIKLLERFKKGDDKAFEFIYHRYQKSAIEFCASIVKDNYEAENIFHDVLLNIWERRSNLKTDFNFKSYLFTSLRNQTFSFIREMKKNDMIKDEFQESCLLQTDNKEEKEKQFVQLECLITELSPKRKEIIKLNFSHGKSYKEIADELLISTNTVKNQLVKAKKLIRDAIN